MRTNWVENIDEGEMVISRNKMDGRMVGNLGVWGFGSGILLEV